MNTQVEQALPYLRLHPLRHLAQLKYLHVYPDLIDCTVLQQGGSTGMLLSHPAVTPWDAVLYRFADAILMPTSSDPEAAARLAEAAVQRWPVGTPLVFKFCEEHTQAAFARCYPMESTRALISYTSMPGAEAQPDEAVIVSETISPEMEPFLLENHYSREELDRYVAGGLLTLALYDASELVCACIAYQNFEHIWEIAALRTVSHARRKGYARRVVQTALSEVLRRGLTPRYQAEDTNTASLALAESLGMQVCLRFEHYRTV